MGETPVDMLFPVGQDAAIAVTRTITISWGIIIAVLVACLLLRKRLTPDRPGAFQALVEMLVEKLEGLVRDVIRSDPAPYMPLAQGIFVFIFVANLAGIVPGLSAPSADIAFTAALAIVVFFAVPFYGIRAKGARTYFASYLKPNPVMLPFTLIGEVTRTLSLAVRLFGNMMSGQFLLGIIIMVVAMMIKGRVALIAPVGAISLGLMLFISVLSLITAVIQPLIFTVLALVYIGAAVERDKERKQPTPQPVEGGMEEHGL